MKTTLQIITTLMGLVLVSAVFAGENSPVGILFAAMREGKYDEQYDIYAFPKLTTNNIPELLEHAARTNLLTNIPVNQFSSMAKLGCSEGMVAVWLIEGIRVGGRFPSQVPECYDKSKTVLPTAAFYAEADQSVVAEAYKTWWKNTNGRQTGAGPLDESSLTWFGGRKLEDVNK